ncbi:MAG: bifunctional phosphopantothenoylcysteine decarboxylase/phosphopantothenate--cysteine ligase CoaBC [bacterium]|nr:bifunctional phosphopantothenoylcysteine decarboxylase/phosphopantothenate--cysteine ligase CoaBC [bacterium]
MKWKDKFIALGVTGSIAAYKAGELIRRMREHGAIVQVIMTKSGTKFITPTTLEQLSNNRVLVDMFDTQFNWQIDHIAVADKADAVLVAPATANIIGKYAQGIADDLLSTTLLATKAPVIIAPAMNENMLLHPAVQENIRTLQSRGVIFIEPEEGMLACGKMGKGRLAEIPVILDVLGEILQTKKDLAGKTVLVTAGPTVEPIDPVRFISNPSSGKMGFALARVAKSRGATVILISGPTQLRVPFGVTYIQVKTAQEMLNAVNQYYPQSQIVVMAAAVADFRPKKMSKRKVKKEIAELSIPLERTPDILAELGKRKGNKILIGFAAESDDIISNAQEKLKKKNLDFIVANDISQPGIGFGSDTNAVILISRKGDVEEIPQMTKEEIAERILDKIATIT